jgi:hypothetical protein
MGKKIKKFRVTRYNCIFRKETTRLKHNFKPIVCPFLGRPLEGQKIFFKDFLPNIKNVLNFGNLSKFHFVFVFVVSFDSLLVML